MENELYHFGVKGMRWGKRKAKTENIQTNTQKQKSALEVYRESDEYKQRKSRNKKIALGVTAATAALGYIGYKKLKQCIEEGSPFILGAAVVGGLLFGE